MKKIILLAILCIQGYLLLSQKFDYETYTYYTDDSTALELDLFLPDSMSEEKACVIFIHGGGFSNGRRANGRPFCQFLSDQGIAAASISYTLSMKGKSFSCDGIRTEKIRTIQLAAHQARIATQWILDRQDSLDINGSHIFLAGSSAGAEAALQAAYWDTSSANYFTNIPGNGFKYAGVISGAGAILDINQINEQTKIPTLCYHGTCDNLVPYYIAAHHYCPQIASGFMLMFGGFAIYERLNDLNETSQLMTYCGEGHQHAGTAFRAPESYNVLAFIKRVLAGEKFTIHRVFDNGEDCNLSLDFIHCFRGM